MLYIYQHIHFCRHLVISIGDVEIWAAWDGSMDDIQSSWDSWTRTSVLVSFGLYISRYHRSYYHSSFFHLFWLPPLLPIMVYGLAHHSDECPELRTLTKYRDTCHQPLNPPPPTPPKKAVAVFIWDCLKNLFSVCLAVQSLNIQAQARMFQKTLWICWWPGSAPGQTQYLWSQVMFPAQGLCDRSIPKNER